MVTQVSTLTPPHGLTSQRWTARPDQPEESEKPELIRDVAAALDGGEPLALLRTVSALLAAFDVRSRQFTRPPQSPVPSTDELVATLFGVKLKETSALLAVIAELVGDEALRRQVQAEISKRAHVLPEWLTNLRLAEPMDRAVAVRHVFGYADDTIVGVRLPSGHELVALVYIDHNTDAVVKDAFVVSEPLPVMIERIQAVADDSAIMVHDLDLAEARARISAAVELAALTSPPMASYSWPACRPLLEWMVRKLPGARHRRPG
jgi:hypothetical protein